MSERLMKVLQDTRNADNPNLCEFCKATIQPALAQFTADYEIYLYECKQCGAVSSLLLECLKSE